MVLKIKRKDLNKIFQHARRSHPLEACGILAGRKFREGKNVEKVYPTRNVLNSTYEYQIDPEEQLKIFEEIELKGLDILGFYHSHPSWEPFWSVIDEERSKLCIGYSYLIVSPKSGSFNSYVRKRDNVEREEVELL